MTITRAFNRRTSQREEGIIMNYFKKLLLSFIISNNISFYAVITPSIKKLLAYLN